MGTETTILITGHTAHLALEMQRRESTNSSDYWDGNWIVIRFQATVPGFHADFNATVHLREIVELRKQLTAMYTALEGRVEWKAMDGVLELAGEMDRLGHIQWTIELIYPTGVGARLLLEIHNDQTYLPAILNQIDDCLEAYPCVGSATGA